MLDRSNGAVLFGPHEVGKTWVTRQAKVDSLRFADAREVWLNIPDSYRTDAVGAARRAFARVIAELGESADAESVGVRDFARALLRMSGRVLLVVDGGELFGSAAGQWIAECVSEIRVAVERGRPPFDRLGLIVHAQAPMRLVTSISLMNRSARTEFLEVNALSVPDASQFVRTRAPNWTEDEVAAAVEVTGGLCGLLSQLVRRRGTTGAKLVELAHTPDGPLSRYLTQVQAALSDRPGGLELLRRLRDEGTVRVSPEALVFLASWGFIRIREDWSLSLDADLDSGVPAVAKWARELRY